MSEGRLQKDCKREGRGQTKLKVRCGVGGEEEEEKMTQETVRGRAGDHEQGNER